MDHSRSGRGACLGYRRYRLGRDGVGHTGAGHLQHGSATAPTTASATATASASPALKAFLNSTVGRRLKALLGQAQQNQKLNQERLQSVINLVKAEMTPADQTQLTQLLAQITSERQAVKQANTTLRNSTSELRSLIDKYLLPASAGSTSTTSTSTPSTPATI